jgi:hypothetical protein
MSSRLFFGAGGLIAVSAFMPWVTALTIIQAHLTGGYILLVLVVGAAYGGAGYMVGQRRVTLTLLNGIWALNALTAFGVIVIFDVVGGLGNELVSPAAGVFIAGIGVITGVAATVQLHRAGAPLPHVLARVATELRRITREGQSTVATPLSGATQRSPITSRQDAPTTPPESTPSPQPVQVYCQDCGKPMYPDQRYCPACGVKQAETG